MYVFLFYRQARPYIGRLRVIDAKLSIHLDLDHKRDIIERSSRGLWSYTHIKKPEGEPIFFLIFYSSTCQGKRYNVKKCPRKHEKQPSKIAYSSIIEEFTLLALRYPNGPKLKIHVGNWAEELCYIQSVTWMFVFFKMQI